MTGPDDDVNDDVREDVLDAWDIYRDSADDAETLEEIRESIESDE